MKEYIDLGLPSGTLWCTENEEGYFTYDKAIKNFKNNLPTKEQWEELVNECSWDWDYEKKGYNVIGLNDNSIFLPTNGFMFRKNKIHDVGIGGNYWCLIPSVLSCAWNLGFSLDIVLIYYTECSYGQSVRLIKNK